MEHHLPRPMPEDRCLVEVGWILAACRQRWASEYKYVSTALPVVEVARAAGKSAGVLAGETVMAEHYRAKRGFELPE